MKFLIHKPPKKRGNLHNCRGISELFTAGSTILQALAGSNLESLFKVQLLDPRLKRVSLYLCTLLLWVSLHLLLQIACVGVRTSTYVLCLCGCPYIYLCTLLVWVSLHLLMHIACVGVLTSTYVHCLSRYPYICLCTLLVQVS